jgi:transcriptional regulator with XRE-family HTH domain
MTNTELKSIRKTLDLSKTDFARAIGISPVMEGKYEKGSREIPEEVSQAAIDLLNSAEQETDYFADEETTPVAEEEATPVTDDNQAEEAAPVAEEPAASDADEDQASQKISASVIEVAVAVAEKSPAKEEKNAAADDAFPAKNEAGTANWSPAVLPFFLPPLMITQFLLNSGILPKPKKKGFFGPWW